MSALNVARKHMTEASAALKTSLFKWSPDYMVAAHCYEKAGVSFRAAGAMEECLDAYRKSAEMQLKQGNDLSAAKALEQAGEILVGLSKDNMTSIEQGVQQAEQAAQLFREACSYYRVGGEGGKAAATMLNQGKALALAAEKLPEGSVKREALLNEALEYFLGSCEILEESGRLAFSVDTFRHTLNFTVKMNRWQDAVKVIDRMIPVFVALKQKSGINKLRLSKVVLQLKRNDLTSARNAFREGFDDSDYLRSDECAAAEDLVRAWEKLDNDAVQEVLQKPVFNYLERQISVVARDLNPFSATGMQESAPTPAPVSTPAPAPAPAPAAAPAHVAAAAPKIVEQDKTVPAKIEEPKQLEPEEQVAAASPVPQPSTGNEGEPDDYVDDDDDAFLK